MTNILPCFKQKRGNNKKKHLHFCDFLEFWEDDGESVHGDERAWFLHVYFRVGRNPYVFCPHRLRMRVETETRRPSDSTKGC